MKLGFWTLGMPPWSNEETAKHAAELGLDGVDLRVTRGENGKPTDRGNLCLESSDADIEATRKAFGDAVVEISSLLLYNRGGLGGPKTDWDAMEKDVVNHVRFAKRVGVARVRVGLGRPDSETSWDSHLQNVFRVVQNSLSEAPGLGAVFENHVGAGSGEELLALSEKTGDSRIGIELSPDHCLVMQEDPVELIDRYAPWVHQICYADRRVVQEELGKFDGRYYYVRYEACLCGEGLVPAAKIFDKLSQKGFDGYISLKWEKSDRFGLELPEGDIALRGFTEFAKLHGLKQRVAVSR